MSEGGNGNGNGGGDDPTLSDDPGDKGKGEELDNLVEHQQGQADAEYRRDAAGINVALQAVELETFDAPILTDAQVSAQWDADMSFIMPGDNPELTELERDTKRTFSQIAEQPTDRQQWNTQRYIALFSGIAAGGSVLAALFTLIWTIIHGRDDSSNPLPDAVKQKVRQLVKQWWYQSDTDFWKSLATALETNAVELTIADQILFMNYTITLDPGTPFLWQNATDLTNRVQRLFEKYRASGSKTAPMYRLVATMTYKNAPLPRAVEATLLRYALVKIQVLG